MERLHEEIFLQIFLSLRSHEQFHFFLMILLEEGIFPTAHGLVAVDICETGDVSTSGFISEWDVRDSSDNIVKDNDIKIS